ncbi:charged multivesicular body protein 5-like isoform X1 [Asparagus officinalis]|uniref:charged multivesicular body protein 5-like isoform X1 n=1 Tax=Asparagus officinalis TaxID=4686 RepID=UPI00098E514B|nr:charged multivesicular body protein 5-like isoform X1 [Asparagus officinalis]
MKRVFGAKKNKEPPPTIQDATDRINKRGDTVDEKIKKLDAELARYREQIKKTRPGPAQEAVKARAMRVLKQKKMYEGQRDMLYNQTFNLDQVAFAAEGIKDAQQTVSALKSANKELKGMMKTVKIEDIDSMQDEMMDLMDVSSEIQESLGRSYNIPDDIDEDDLMGGKLNFTYPGVLFSDITMHFMGTLILDRKSWFFVVTVVYLTVLLLVYVNAELDALEADMGAETESDAMPSYLQPDTDLDAELNLPAAPTGNAVQNRPNAQAEDEFGLPAVPRASLRG